MHVLGMPWQLAKGDLHSFYCIFCFSCTHSLGSGAEKFWQNEISFRCTSQWPVWHHHKQVSGTGQVQHRLDNNPVTFDQNVDCSLSFRLEAKLTADREQFDEERRELHETYDKQQQVSGLIPRLLAFIIRNIFSVSVTHNNFWRLVFSEW